MIVSLSFRERLLLLMGWRLQLDFGALKISAYSARVLAPWEPC
jgi:hypothetical protein